MQERSLARLRLPTLDSGTIEAIKWLAALSMLFDHVNRYLLNQNHPWMFELGRLALPLFCWILAYNLAQSDPRSNAVYLRVLKRLALTAFIALLPYQWLSSLQNDAGFTLNILFTLATGISVVCLFYSAHRWGALAACLLALSAGGFVEYGWIGIGVFISAWTFFRNPNLWTLGIAVVFVMALGPIYNENHWALLSLPLFALSLWIRIPVCRIRHAFYYFYPGHLLTIALLQSLS